MRACFILAAVILLAVVLGTDSMTSGMQESRITEGQPGKCNKRIYFCFLNPCQTRANTCRDPRDCRPDYCGGCKTKCVTTTPVPERAIVRPTTRASGPPFSTRRPDYFCGCKTKYVTRIRSRRPCGACSSSRRT